MSWKMQVIKRFDSAPATYDAAADVQRYSGEKLLSLAPENVSSVLEIGCGTGALSKMIAEKYTSAHLHFTDISPSMLSNAKIKLSGVNAEWSVMDAEKPQLTRTYDLIIANMVFQWLEDREAAIERLRGYLNAGGVILFSQPAPESFPQWRESLKSLGLESGLLDFQATPYIIEHEEVSVDYGSTSCFLKGMKDVGAQKSRAGYKQLSLKCLKAAIKHCDAHHGGKITWHINYARG
ncbi:MAG: methyltransferase [Micavibrio sp.]|nr:methyltransferase [Micavibrio sp.]